MAKPVPQKSFNLQEEMACVDLENPPANYILDRMPLGITVLGPMSEPVRRLHRLWHAHDQLLRELTSICDEEKAKLVQKCDEFKDMLGLCLAYEFPWLPDTELTIAFCEGDRVAWLKINSLFIALIQLNVRYLLGEWSWAEGVMPTRY